MNVETIANVKSTIGLPSMLVANSNIPIYKITDHAKMVPVGTLRVGDRVLIDDVLRTTDLFSAETTRELPLLRLAISTNDDPVEHFYIVVMDGEIDAVMEAAEDSTIEKELLYQLQYEIRFTSNKGTVYYGPGKFFKEVHTLNKGEKFLVKGQYGAYTHIEKEGRWSGYVESSLIKLPETAIERPIDPEPSEPVSTESKKKDRPIEKEFTQAAMMATPKPTAKPEPVYTPEPSEIGFAPNDVFAGWMHGEETLLLLKLNTEPDDKEKLDHLLETVRIVCDQLAALSDVELAVDPDLTQIGNESDFELIRSNMYPGGNFLPVFLAVPMEKGDYFTRKLQKLLMAKGIRTIRMPSYPFNK